MSSSAIPSFENIEQRLQESRAEQVRAKELFEGYAVDSEEREADAYYYYFSPEDGEE